MDFFVNGQSLGWRGPTFNRTFDCNLNSEWVDQASGTEIDNVACTVMAGERVVLFCLHFFDEHISQGEIESFSDNNFEIHDYDYHNSSGDHGDLADYYDLRY